MQLRCRLAGARAHEANAVSSTPTAMTFRELGTSRSRVPVSGDSLGYAQGTKTLNAAKPPKATLLDAPKGQALAHVGRGKVINGSHASLHDSHTPVLHYTNALGYPPVKASVRLGTLGP